MTSLIAGLAFQFFMAAQPARPMVSSFGTDSSEMTLVVVQNDRDVPVTVYAQNDIGERKIGVVAPFSIETIRIDQFMFGRTDIQFFVQPAGEIELGTDHMLIERGEHLGLIVPPTK